MTGNTEPPTSNGPEMKCRICKTENTPCFSATIMNKHHVEYFHCNTCGFIQTEEPCWLDEAYDRPINKTDTGYLDRNLRLSAKLTIAMHFHFRKDGLFLDYAGGHGIFVRLMRDIGYDFYWADKYSDNLFASGFEWDENMGEVEAITALECFEHFIDPIDETKNLLRITDNIILTTALVPKPIPKPDEWWYYGLDHGQHIAFYSKETFNFIARELDLNYANFGNLHFLTKDRIPAYKIRLLALSKISLHTLLRRSLTSKTWEDHLLLKALTKQDADNS